ncbi:MAG: hypothetical protein SFY68_03020 [Candidatus Sumerlaeia bacterium]|nr:hypothetical protein [Candidatus Sumerlaeia bacterium]
MSALLLQTLHGKSWLSALLSLLFITVCSFVVGLVPIRADNDCWWHVKSGEYISENGLPEHDVFNYMAESYEWHNHEWLTQVLMWKAYQAGESTIGGWRGVIFATASVIWVTMVLLWVLAARISGNHWIALFVVLMALGLGRRTYYPRPPVVTNLLIAVMLLILYAVQERGASRWLLLGLPAMFALWSNLHGGWFAGLVVLSAFGLQNIVQHLTHRSEVDGSQAPPLMDTVPHPIPWVWLLTIGPACFLATLLNPFTYHLYALPARVLSNKELVQSLGELLPPDINHVTDFVLWTMFVVVAALIGGVRGRARRLGEVLLVLFFFWQAIHHVRHLLLLSVVMVPLVTRLLTGVVEETADYVARWNPRLRVIGSLAAFAGALFWGALVVLNYSSAFANLPKPTVAGLIHQSYIGRFHQYRNVPGGYLTNGFPHHLCNYIELLDLQGRMFNENNYAGYLIWRFGTERRVFSDPRFDIFGADIWNDEVTITKGEPEWEQLLQKHGVTYVLARDRTILDVLLDEDEDWELVADFSTLTTREGFPLSDKPWRVYILKSAYPEGFATQARRVYEGYRRQFGG